MHGYHLLILGLGYTGAEIARRAVAAGFRVTATSRNPAALTPPPGVGLIAFDAAAPALQAATHLLQTAPPGEGGDPALHHFQGRLGTPEWAGMLSTTGVYGDRGGAWVDEDTPPAPTGPRGQRRLEAEQAWTAAFPNARVDLFRVAGIYGPGRSVLNDVREGRARRVDKPGHLFGRIHRDDIAMAVLAALRQDRPPGPRTLNLNDDEPAANADVTAYAAKLLGSPEPPLIPFDQALAAMTPMGRSFWAENRRVASRKTQARLAITWRYPTYREGLQAILAAETTSPTNPNNTEISPSRDNR
jgi:nucleoside-diphosphate-sugar epimerase